jgi:hypothetical protein
VFKIKTKEVIMSDLAKFLKSIGLDLKGEEQPELKTIPILKMVKKVVDGRVCNIEEECGKEYHIYPYKAFGSIVYTTPQDRAHVQKPLLIIDGKSEKGEKIAGYLNKIFIEAAYKQPIPYYGSKKSSSY